MVIILFLLWLDLKNEEKKSKNQKKSKKIKEFDSLIISLLSRLCIWFLLSLLFLIYCGICTKQEMELLTCDLTPCHLCQFFIDLRWGRMYLLYIGGLGWREKPPGLSQHTIFRTSWLRRRCFFKILIVLILWLIEMVYIHLTSTKVSFKLILLII